MELLNRRISSGAESTLGTLFELLIEPPKVPKPRFLCYMLEDQWNDPKIPGETRIPPGRYQIKLRTEGGLHKKYGERFQWHRGMLWLQDVPNFKWIYIHVGNDDDDTEGCPLVGDAQVSNNVGRGSLGNSVAAYRRLYQEIVARLSAGEEVWITMEDYA